MGGSSNVQQQQPASGKGPSQPQQGQQGQQTNVPQNVLNSYSQQQQSSYGQPQGYYGRQQFQPQPQPQQQFQPQPQQQFQQQPQQFQQQPQQFQQQPQQQQAGYYGQSGSSQQPQNMLNQFMQAQQMGGMQPATGKGAQQGPGQLGGSQQAATFNAGRANPEQMFNDFNAARTGQPGQGSQQAVAPSTNGAGIPPDVMDRYNQANPQQAEGQFGQFNQQQRQDAAMQAAQQAQLNQQQRSPQEMIDAQVKEAGAHGVTYTQEERQMMLQNAMEQNARQNMQAPGEMGASLKSLDGTPADNLGPQLPPEVFNNYNQANQAQLFSQQAQDQFNQYQRQGSMGIPPSSLTGTPADNLGPQFSPETNQTARRDAAMQAAQQAQNPMFNQFQQQQQQGLPPTASGKGASQLRGGMFSRGGYAGGGDVAPPGMSLLMMERK